LPKRRNLATKSANSESRERSSRTPLDRRLSGEKTHRSRPGRLRDEAGAILDGGRTHSGPCSDAERAVVPMARPLDSANARRMPYVASMMRAPKRSLSDRIDFVRSPRSRCRTRKPRRTSSTVPSTNSDSSVPWSMAFLRMRNTAGGGNLCIMTCRSIGPSGRRVARLDVPFYLHPRNPLPEDARIYDGHPWLLGLTWGFAQETAVHALRLIAPGLFDEHPSLRTIVGHLGEGIPAMLHRVDHRNMWVTAPHTYPAARKFADYFHENFYVTTSGTFRTQTLIDAVLELGADRILFATDWPFENIDHAANWFDAASIADPDRERSGARTHSSSSGFDDRP
jgi:hypothetical protein